MNLNELMIGIDVGTTGTKSMVVDVKGNIISSAYQGYPTYNSKPKYSEQEADDWWKAVVSTVRECTADDTVRRSVVSIGLSSQGGSMVPVDGNGVPLRRAFVWIDKRGEKQCEYFRKNTSEDYFYLTTGWELSLGLNAVQIRWMMENEQELFSRTDKFLSTIDFVNMKLTGSAFIDPSNAGITQLINLSRMDWDSTIMELAGITKEKLPQIISSGKMIGKLTAKAAEELGLSKDVQVVSGGHDQYCVALGAGAVNTGDVLLATGTAWVTLRVSDKPMFDSQTHLAQSVHTVSGKWGSIGSLDNGGSSLKWFRDNFGKYIVKDGEAELESYQQIDSFVEKKRPGANGVTFYPFFNGTSIPNYDTLSKATIMGLDLSNDRYDVARAVMESVVFQTKRNLELFDPANKDFTNLKMLGGATRSSVWRQMVVDIMGKPIKVPQVADIACVGAAILAGCGANLFPDTYDGYLRLKQEETEYFPDQKSANLYKELYEIFKKRSDLLAECYTNIH